MPLTFSPMTKERRSAKTTKTNQTPTETTRMKPNDLSVLTICAGDLSGFRNERAAASRESALIRFTSL